MKLSTVIYALGRHKFLGITFIYNYYAYCIIVNNMENNNSKFIDYLDKKFSKIDTEFKDLKGDFRKLQSSVDSYSYETNTYLQELTMLSSRLNRHENWIKKNAGKTGIDLNN
ncbi:MAG: hypothetical protein WD607_00695 [Candidatus Paceibacterota bacterium]